MPGLVGGKKGKGELDDEKGDLPGERNFHQGKKKIRARKKTGASISTRNTRFRLCKTFKRHRVGRSAELRRLGSQKKAPGEYDE